MFDGDLAEAGINPPGQLIAREIVSTKSTARIVDWTDPRGEVWRLTIPATVYPPRQDTSLLALALDEITSKQGGDFLEIGCGSGAVSLYAHDTGWNVVACDINPYAVAATRGLAESHAAEHLDVVEGGLEPGTGLDPRLSASGPYDVIAWNLPYLKEPCDGQRLGPLEEASLSQSTIEDGRPLDALLRLAIERDPTILRASGVVLLVHNDRDSGRMITSRWRRSGWASREIRSATQADGERLVATACWRPWHLADMEHAASLTSTNSHLLESDSPIGTLLTCEHQTAGRGQRGRTWEDFGAGWAGSWMLDASTTPGLAQLAAGVAVCEAIAAIEDRVTHSFDMAADEASRLYLRWPNDVMFEDKKVCGILAQARTRGKEMRLVLGIGVNLGDVTEEQSERVGGAAGLLQATSVEFDRFEWTTVLHACMASWFEQQEMLGSGDREACIRPWWMLASKHLSVSVPTKSGYDFRVIGVDQDGALRLVDEEERLDSAESTFESFEIEWL